MPYSSVAANSAGLVKTPEGSEYLRFSRWTSPWGNILQTVAALVFASYFFILPGALMMLLASYVFSWLPVWSMVLAILLYGAQLFLLKPHRAQGWPFFFRMFMYGTPFCEWVLRYYDATVIREGHPLDPSQQYLFAIAPHGVYGVCRAFSGGSGCFCKLFPGIVARWGAFSVGFYIPGVREFSLAAGCVDASKEVLRGVVARHENIMLLPGGIDEMGLTDGTSLETKLVLLDRKGFTKLALETGCSIVPAFCFGEKWLHEAVHPPPWLSRFLYRLFRVSGTIPKGRGPTFLGKLGVPIGLVWGQPIVVDQKDFLKLSKEERKRLLDKTHLQVQSAIQDIFDRHKASFGYSKQETLRFVTVAEARGKAV